MTRLVLLTYGNVCHLQLTGCRGTATTKDHLVPYSKGGDDSLDNYRPACKPCNSKRQDRAYGSYGARIVIVIGPPAAGKTTHIQQHAKPWDVTIDMDAIARALMPIQPETTHTYPDHVRHVAMAARSAAIKSATRLHERCTVWLIHAIPHPADLADYKQMGWEVVTIDPGRDVVEGRVKTMRPEQMQRQVARWYSVHGKESEPARALQPADSIDASAAADW